MHVASLTANSLDSTPVLVSPTFETRAGSSSEEDGPRRNSNNDLLGYVTKTVTGFLDFTTTVGNTVMVFTPEGGKRKIDGTLLCCYSLPSVCPFRILII